MKIKTLVLLLASFAAHAEFPPMPNMYNGMGSMGGYQSYHPPVAGYGVQAGVDAIQRSNDQQRQLELLRRQVEATEQMNRTYQQRNGYYRY